MGVIIEISLIVILGFCIFRGYKKGLVRSFLVFVNSIAALVGSFLLANWLTTGLVKYFPFPGIGANLGSFLQNEIEFSGNLNINELLQGYGLPSGISQTISDSINSSVSTIGSSVKQAVSDSVNYLLSYIIIFILAFVILIIVLNIITRIIDGIVKLPILNQANKLLGLLFGLCKGILIVFVLCLIVRYSLPLVDISFDTKYADSLDNTFVFKLFDSINFLKF